ncbi:hypothetical protein [Uliginosibacterium sediminicola]|uniref:Uncharacterized protein n=1 Tax=Uliginosibacterium sediminicola TaxID=2024550 RepID=A0ABU9YWE4_9RHOO
MILTLEGGGQIPGDLIESAVLRSDLAPVPVTLEAVIRTTGTDDLSSMLAEGRTVTTGLGDVMHIAKTVPTISAVAAQGDTPVSAVQITAMLDDCKRVSYRRDRALIKERATLGAIYRAAGAKVNVDGDFAVPRFSCLVGGTPSFHIAQVLQEEGGVVRWKKGRLQFFRLVDLFKQSSVMALPNIDAQDVKSEFLERHEVPWFFSLDESGSLIYGARETARSVRFSPFTNALRLRNMSDPLLVRKVVPRAAFSSHVCAGDVIDFVGGVPLAVITAAHVFKSGSDGHGRELYSRFWLGGLS